MHSTLNYPLCGCATFVIQKNHLFVTIEMVKGGISMPAMMEQNASLSALSGISCIATEMGTLYYSVLTMKCTILQYATETNKI